MPLRPGVFMGFVALPAEGSGFSLTLTAPPTEGIHHEMIKLVAFQGDNLPVPPMPADKLSDMAPEDLERWLMRTPDSVREEAVVVYRVGR